MQFETYGEVIFKVIQLLKGVQMHKVYRKEVAMIQDIYDSYGSEAIDEFSHRVDETGFERVLTILFDKEKELGGLGDNHFKWQ